DPRSIRPPAGSAPAIAVSGLLLKVTSELRATADWHIAAALARPFGGRDAAAGWDAGLRWPDIREVRTIRAVRLVNARPGNMFPLRVPTGAEHFRRSRCCRRDFLRPAAGAAVCVLKRNIKQERANQCCNRCKAAARPTSTGCCAMSSPGSAD